MENPRKSPLVGKHGAYLGHQLIQERILSDFTANPVAMKGAPLSGFVGNNE